jgi:hypothetical protein
MPQRESKLGTKDPYEIRFTQDSINGNVLDYNCERICNGEQAPPIRVFKQQGDWYSLDNRRLAASQLTGQSEIAIQRVYLCHQAGHDPNGNPTTIRKEAAWKMQGMKKKGQDGTDVRIRQGSMFSGMISSTIG